MFADCHPAVNMAFFCMVIIFGMLVQHPIFLCLSFGGSLAYSLYLGRKKALRLVGKLLLPLMLVAALFNPIFNHQGITLLFYIKRTPITLEATVYGLCAALLFGTMVLWCYCGQKLLTSDKITFLFGRRLPAIGALFTLVLGLVPRYRRQLERIRQAQKSLGQEEHRSSLMDKVRLGGATTAILTTWAFEGALDTADSMKARGFGLKGRTHYGRYTWEKRDWILLGGLVLVSLGLCWGIQGGYTAMDFYPALKMAALDGGQILVALDYGLLCFMPLLLQIWEDLRWKRLQSAI